MKQALKEAGEGQRWTHMGFINAVVPVSNHVIHWSARLGASLTRKQDNEMLSWFGWRYKPRFMRWSGWKEMPELSTGWSFKASKIMKW